MVDRVAAKIEKLIVANACDDSQTAHLPLQDRRAPQAAVGRLQMIPICYKLS
jgi:hypothetical protein